MRFKLKGTKLKDKMKALVQFIEIVLSGFNAIKKYAFNGRDSAENGGKNLQSWAFVSFQLVIDKRLYGKISYYNSNQKSRNKSNRAIEYL
jgi:hypothetical protein